MTMLFFICSAAEECLPSERCPRANPHLLNFQGGTPCLKRAASPADVAVASGAADVAVDPLAVTVEPAHHGCEADKLRAEVKELETELNDLQSVLCAKSAELGKIHKLAVGSTVDAIMKLSEPHVRRTLAIGISEGIERQRLVREAAGMREALVASISFIVGLTQGIKDPVLRAKVAGIISELKQAAR